MRFRERKHRHLVVVAGLIMMLGLSNATVSFAAEPLAQTQQQVTQSNRWEGTGDTWLIKAQDGNGYLTNSWFQDLDGSWYMLGADGYMYAGLITDRSSGKSYLLNTNHDGTYGRMLTVDGVYTVNNKQIYLTFNQAHDGSYGAIITGLLDIRNSGVRETQLSSIPTDSAETEGQNSNTQGQQQSWNTGNNDSKGEDIDLGNGGTDGKSIEDMTDEELDRLLEEQLGITIDNGGTIDTEANRGMNLQG